MPRKILAARPSDHSAYVRSQLSRLGADDAHELEGEGMEPWHGSVLAPEDELDARKRELEAMREGPSPPLETELVEAYIGLGFASPFARIF